MTQKISIGLGNKAPARKARNSLESSNDSRDVPDFLIHNKLMLAEQESGQGGGTAGLDSRVSVESDRIKISSPKMAEHMLLN